MRVHRLIYILVKIEQHGKDISKLRYNRYKKEWRFCYWTH